MKLRSRVKVVKTYAYDARQLLGKIGVVTAISTDEPLSICVQFKGWTHGHAGETNDDLDVVDRWYFKRDALRVLPRRKKSKKRKKVTR